MPSSLEGIRAGSSGRVVRDGQLVAMDLGWTDYEARELAPDEASQGQKISAADGSRRPGNPPFYYSSVHVIGIHL